MPTFPETAVLHAAEINSPTSCTWTDLCLTAGVAVELKACLVVLDGT